MPQTIYRNIKGDKLAMIPVSILVSSHNNLSYCKQMFDSLKRCTKYPYELIWIDADSGVEMRKWLETIKNEQPTTIIFEKAISLSKAYNIGLDNSESEYVAIVDTDVILTYNWLTKLLKWMETDKIGQCGMLSNFAPSWQCYGPSKFSSFDEIQEFAKTVNNHELRDCRWCNISHTLYNRQALTDVGGLDEEYFTCMELDFSKKMRELGWRIVVALDVWVYHYGHKTWELIHKTRPTWASKLDAGQRLVRRRFPKDYRG